MATGTERRTTPGRRGRQLGIAVFAAIVTTFTGVCSFQIIRQAWGASGASTDADCRRGLVALIHAVYRAREVAVQSPGGEREALTHFRSALLPEWSLRDGLARACAADAEALKALPEIDRLRYAEEHALRYEALDVASRRLRVAGIERALGERP